MSFRFNFKIDDNCENSHDSTEVSEAVTEPKKLKLKGDISDIMILIIMLTMHNQSNIIKIYRSTYYI